MADTNVDSQQLEQYARNPRAAGLEGAVQHYDWGGYDFIPGLIGADNSAHQPWAELWIGAHPSAPSVLELDGRAPLDKVIQASPDSILGSRVAARFEDRLPYLFKVLDARKMLSIQAHPTKQQAEEGFARENEAGVPPKAPERNYKDDNHKPEVHVALTDFWMLHGFRPLEEIAGVLSATPELAGLAPEFGRGLEGATGPAERKALLRALYGKVMTMAQAEIDALLNPLVARLNKEAPSDKDAPDYWALRAAETFPLPDGHRDRGIVSIYLLNLVHLKPGQGTYQPAGMLHAYLEGTNMELMANSDNVLRGGLTPKHVDVAELMNVLTFEDGPSDVLNGEQASETQRVYRTPAAEFELSRIELGQGKRFNGGNAHSADSIITLEGAARLTSEGETLEMPRGRIAFVPAGVGYDLEASEPAVLYKASVPAGV